MKKILLLLSLIVVALSSAAQLVDALPLDKFGWRTTEQWKSPLTNVDYLLCGTYDSDDGERICLMNGGNDREGVAANGTDVNLQKIVISWCEPDHLYGDGLEGCVLVAYGRETPYTSIDEIYDESTRGVEIGRVTYPDTELTVTGSYSNVGFIPGRKATSWLDAELRSIDFYWEASLEPMEPIVVKDTDGNTLVDGRRYAAFGANTYQITSATPDVTFTWSMGSQSGKGVGSAYVTVTGSGELNITAEKDGFFPKERTIVFEDLPLAEAIHSVYEVWQTYPMLEAKDGDCGEAFEVDFEATVVYAAEVNGYAQIIIYDGTNFSSIQWLGGSADFAPGDVLAKGWYATYGRYHAWKSFVPLSPLTVASHDGTVPAPVAVGSEEILQSLDPGTPVVVKGVILACATSSEAYNGDEAFKQIQTKNSPVALVNAFGIASVDSARYDVYGVMDFYGYKRTNAPAYGPTDGDYSHRRWRVAVTRFELWKPTSPRPVFALANDSEVDSGEPIVITCQDEAATIMYSMDGENYSEYDAANPPVMPAEDVTVSAYSRQEGYHDSAVRRVSLRYSGKAGIADITLDPAGAAEYYDLTGRRVDNPKAGMYIRVQSGRATKVIL